MKVSLIFLLSFVMSQSVMAASYTITLTGFGSNRTDCDGDISRVAHAFADNANVTILESGCSPPEVGEINSSGTFTYVSPQFVSTTSSEATEANRFDGYYDTWASCESALRFEREAFVRMTKLEPYVAYCYRANAVGPQRFRARLDAVGQSSVNKHALSTSWVGRSEDPRKLVAAVEMFVRDEGGEVTAAKVDSDTGGYMMALDYYHTATFYLHSQEILHWQSITTCQQNAAILNLKWDPSPIKSFFQCSQSRSGEIRLLQVYLSKGILSGFDFNTRLLSTTYHAQNSCLEDTPRIQHALEQAGKKVIALVCGQERSLHNWRVLAFTVDN